MAGFCRWYRYIFYGVSGEEAKAFQSVTESVVKADNLISDTDYEFCIQRNDSVKSNIGLVHRVACPEGTIVINCLHPEDTHHRPVRTLYVDCQILSKGNA